MPHVLSHCALSPRSRKDGRRPKLSSAQVKLARELYDKREHTVQHIADLVGVSRPTLYAHLERQRAA
jgi:DNA-binding MarR family transcriptional regulator